jgi:outer membrane protein assembly factor BamB
MRIFVLPGLFMEANLVGALDAVTGHAVWRTPLAPPAPRSALPCGNVDALGIAGTPVIDPAASAPYGAGSPITTTSDGGPDRIVWITGAQGDDRLHGFRGDNGMPVFTGGGPAERIPEQRHFTPVLAAERRLYVAGDGGIYAFSTGPRALL